MQDRVLPRQLHSVEPIHARYPAGRMWFPEDLGGLALLLASDAASFIHGQIFVADGGRLAGGQVSGRDRKGKHELRRDRYDAKSLWHRLKCIQESRRDRD